MEESKELQGFYKIFRAVIYISVLMEFFEYAIDPRTIDGFGGVVCDLHDRIKQWFIYHDGNLVYSKVVTFLLVCITCVGTRNKKHLEFDARRQVLYPLVSGVLLLILSVWLFGYAMDTRLYTLRLKHHSLYGDNHHRNGIGAYRLGQHLEVLEGRTDERPFQF